MVVKSSLFWDVTPCSPLKANRRFGGTCLNFQGQKVSQAKKNQLESRRQALLVSPLTYSSTPKIEVTCSSEKSVDIQRTTWLYILEDRTLLYELLLSHILAICPVHFSLICSTILTMLRDVCIPKSLRFSMLLFSHFLHPY
jgi:hypothetical protein